MMWSALFQQEPTPDDGDYFKAEWLKEHKELPDRDTLKVYGASDYAVTADGGDYTVHIVVGIDTTDARGCSTYGGDKLIVRGGSISSAT